MLKSSLIRAFIQLNYFLHRENILGCVDSFKLLSEVFLNAARWISLQEVNSIFSFPFCLGIESNGQPAPESANVIDTAVTKPGDSEQTEISSDDSIEVIEITLSSPERVESIPSSP